MRRLIMAMLLTIFMAPLQASDIPLLSAGIGEEGREAHDDYSLKLVFFEQGGPYVANVRVRIYDQAGNQLIDHLSDGPWLFVDLAAGNYSVHAERQNGEAQGVKFMVDGRGQKLLSLRFTASE